MPRSYPPRSNTSTCPSASSAAIVASGMVASVSSIQVKVCAWLTVCKRCGSGSKLVKAVTTWAMLMPNCSTTINAGTLQIGGAGSLSSPSSSMVYGGDISIATGATFQYSSTTSSTQTIGSTLAGGVISGGGDLIKDTGSNILSFKKNNTYTGLTTINSGILQLSGDGTLGNTSGVVNNGTLQLSTASSFTISAPISGSGQFKKLNTSIGTTTLTGNNTYTGPTTIAAGTLVVANSSALGNPATPVGSLLMTGGTLQYSGINTDFSGRFATTGSQQWNIDTNGNAVTFGTVLSGTSSLTKTGSGTLTLSETNTYTGTTTINGTGTSATIGNTIVAGYATHYTNGAIDYSPFGASPSLIMSIV
ncbi:MAG: hypothetical protein EBR59_10275 [Methylococcaceae bacterium]|nr:hypothetical protein [Methylococcaceae bacterium]